VLNAPPSEEQIGIMRPRNVLKLDLGIERNTSEMIDSLETNPYVIPLHSTASKVSAGEIKYINDNPHVKLGKYSNNNMQGSNVIDRTAVKKYKS
jgi:hypothetical protein